MNNFKFQSPTKIIFGRGEEKNIGSIIKEYNFKKILFHYGKGSIFKTSLYNDVVTSLKEANIDFIELGGVQANPDIELVRVGVDLVKKENIDFILAVGGGSVIDSAKAIAHGVLYEGDPYDIINHTVTLDKSLPVGVILTLAASGSELSNSCVISNEKLRLKQGFNVDSNRPLFVIENPELTFTLSPNQTAYGIVDILSHTIERYFNKSNELEFADFIAEGLLKSVFQAAEIIKKDAQNYDARATLMIASSYSHNGITGLGKSCYFPIHALEHRLSAVSPTLAHGAGLAILIPAWMRVVYPYDKDKFLKFALNVMDVPFIGVEETIVSGISKLEEFIKSLGLSLHMKDYDLSEENFDEIMKELPKVIQSNVPLTTDLILAIYSQAL